MKKSSFFSLPRTKIVREFKVGHLHDDEMFYIKENCDTSVFHLQKSFEDILDLPLLCNNNVAAVCDILYHVEFNANYIDLKYQKGNRSQTMKDVFPIKKHSVKISVCSVPPSKWTCTYLNFPPFFLLRFADDANIQKVDIWILTGFVHDANMMLTSQVFLFSI